MNDEEEIMPKGNGRGWIYYIIIGQGALVVICFMIIGYMFSRYHSHIEENQKEMMAAMTSLRNEIRAEISIVSKEMQNLCSKIERHDILLRLPFNQRLDIYKLEPKK